MAAALIGTERRPWAGIGGDGRLSELSDAVGSGRDGLPPELLTEASAVWAYREAGRCPPSGVAAQSGVTGTTEAPTPAPEDTRPLLPANAVKSLCAILENRRFRPLLGEWLSLARRHGGRPAPELVPTLLGAVPVRHQAVTVAVVGPLASWLARLNPEWAWAGKVPPQTGAVTRNEVADGEEEVLAKVGSAPLVEAAGALAELPGPWSSELTRDVLAALRAVVASGSLAMPVRDALPAFALAADPGQAATAAGLLTAVEDVPEAKRPAVRSFWERPVTQLVAVLHFRQAMHEEFR